MKKSVILLLCVTLTVIGFAQDAINFTGKGLSFQGIARDADGNAITSTTVSVRFKIGTWSESKDIVVDNFGVFSHIIGSVENTTFQDLDFSKYDYDFTVEVNSNEIFSGKLNGVPYAKAAGNGVPVGSVMPFAGAVSAGSALNEVIPGWLVCNGASIPGDAKYNNLKTVLGNAWGTAKLPDLRGVFLRGLNNGRSDGYKDPDVGSRVAVNGGNSGDNVGSFQGDAFESHDHSAGELENSTNGSHTHKMVELDNGSSVNDDADGDITVDNNGRNDNVERDDRIQAAGNHTHTISGTTGDSGGTETRPINASVNFIIKY